MAKGNKGLDDFLGNLSKKNSGLTKKWKDKPTIQLGEASNAWETLLPESYSYPIATEELEQEQIEFQKTAQELLQKEMELENLPQEEFLNKQVPYLQKLNREQLIAATIGDGPVLIIAGAGTGKTHTLTYRVAWLIENGINPKSIVLLTFTRKASREMLSRCQSLLKNMQVADVNGGTFHSFAVKQFRKYGHLLGIETEITIWDQQDAKDFLDILARQGGYYAKGKKNFPLKQLADYISRSRNLNMGLSEYIEKYAPHHIDYLETFITLTEYYHQAKRKLFAFDFDDLLEEFAKGLEENEAFLNSVRKYISHVLVDEYQDSNALQRRILRAITPPSGNIMVVGDDAQSIYRFRGADYKNIIEFPQDFPKAKLITLVRNYRSDQKLLDFTNAILQQRFIGFPKELVGEDKHAELPESIRFSDPYQEAEHIADRILEQKNNGLDWDHHAILARSVGHTNHIQAEFTKRKIPFVVVGGLRFTDRAHIKDMLAYLRLAVNPFDILSWNRVLKLIPGIGEKSAIQIVQSVQENNGELLDANFLNTRYKDGIIELSSLISELKKPANSVHACIQLTRRYYSKFLDAQYQDAKFRRLDLDQLELLIQEEDSLEEFLNNITLDPPSLDARENNMLEGEEQEETKVTISTVHSAKGLEWHTVFIVHCIDGLFPSIRDTDFEDLEEARRLFYVAASRAKMNLCITLPFEIERYFNTSSRPFPSRFLIEAKNQLKLEW